MNKPLFSIKNLNSHYQVNGKKFHSVRNISFDIFSSETVGLVGESGCGKTTLGKLLLGLIPYSSGEILYQGKSLAKMNKLELLELRKNCQMVFQDSYGSVNPRMTIGEIVIEPMQIYKIGTRKSRKEKLHELLHLVGLDSSFAFRYPHELSGGQKQRVVIARALALDPKFLICDEPIAALDVSIQAQIINLLKDLQSKLGLTYLFISHDLAVVKYLANRTLVMYCGEVVEAAESEDLYKNPLHPYTNTLLNAIPTIDQHVNKCRIAQITDGDPPDPFKQINGCAFASRCNKKLDCCNLNKPREVEVKKLHTVACHLYERPDQNQIPKKEKELDYLLSLI